MLKLNKGLNAGLSFITAIALVLMVLHVVAHALMRFLFNAPISGTNEVVGYWYMPIVILLGIPAAQLQKEHISVTLLTDRLGQGTARVFSRFVHALGLMLCIAFTWYGMEEALENAELGSTAGVSDIITYPVYFLVPLVFALLGVMYIANLFPTEDHEESMSTSTLEPGSLDPASEAAPNPKL